MKFDDLKQDWQNEVNQPLDEGELQQSLRDIQQQCENLELVAYRRDFREILEVFLVVGFFIGAWALLQPTLLAGCGIGLIVFGYLLNLWTLLSCRRPTPAALNASLSESLSHRLSWLDRQIHVLTKSVWWITAPSLIGVPLVAWAMMGDNTPFFILAMILFLAATVYHFRSRSKKAHLHWSPLRQEVRHTIEGLS